MLKFIVIGLGWVYMILAIWWFFRPARMRKVFERTFRKKLRWLFVFLAFTFGGLSSFGISIGWDRVVHGAPADPTILARHSSGKGTSAL